MRLRSFTFASAKTREGYLRYARAYIAYHRRSAAELGTDDVRSWLLWLLKVRKRDAGTVNVAIASLRLLFTTIGRPEVMQSIPNVRKQHRAPDVPSCCMDNRCGIDATMFGMGGCVDLKNASTQVPAMGFIMFPQARTCDGVLDPVDTSKHDAGV